MNVILDKISKEVELKRILEDAKQYYKNALNEQSNALDTVMFANRKVMEAEINLAEYYTTNEKIT